MKTENFIRPNEYPEIIEQYWFIEPIEGSRVKVDYGTSTNSNVWWKNRKFVNVDGFELHNIIGWKYLT